ncbi:MAG: hypothetical protein P8168_00600 [Deltaproteobacteria bacterium]|jgi:hypothetical protein
MQESRLSQTLTPAGARFPGRDRRWRQIVSVLIILLLPGLLGAWRIISGDTIDPRHVKRIQDGKTTKMEILTLFGDPQEIDRSAGSVTYVYHSYKDAPAFPYKPDKRKINPQSDQVFVLDSQKHVKKAPVKIKGHILKSTLLIRFKPGGNTVMSHEFQEY